MKAPGIESSEFFIEKEKILKKKLELYIHIPFCIKKCEYCDFLSGPADASRRTQYVESLIDEIHAMGSQYSKEYDVSTVFIGGGTPSILEETQMKEIGEAIRNSFDIVKDAEITMELNPGTVNLSKLCAMKEAGVNRLSIGLQSANDAELKMLGRIHTFQTFLETYQMARKVGFDNLNVDLISAIPGQTLESWKKTLQIVASLNPEHISAYSLIIEEGTAFYEKYTVDGKRKQEAVLALPDEDTEREIYQMTETFLKKYGYHRYEISNYAKNGFECRHNLGYWERKDYLGIGLGAASLIGKQRFSNTRDYLRYVERKSVLEIREDQQDLTLGDEMEEFMFLGLRKIKGISISTFEKNFQRSIWEIYGKQLRKFEEEKLLVINQDTIYLTEQGLDVCNAIFVEFLDPLGSAEY